MIRLVTTCTLVSPLLLLVLANNKYVVTAQDTATATSNAACTEHPRHQFLNRRGVPRNCDWLGREPGFAEVRISEECSTDLPSDVAVTEADATCPVSCGKCAALVAKVEAEEEEEQTSMTLTDLYEAHQEQQQTKDAAEELEEDNVFGEDEMGADLAEALGLDTDTAFSLKDTEDSTNIGAEVEDTMPTSLEIDDTNAVTQMVEPVDDVFDFENETTTDYPDIAGDALLQEPQTDLLDGLANQLVTSSSSSSARPGRPNLLPSTFHQRRWTDIKVSTIQPDPSRVGIDIAAFATIDPAIVATLVETQRQYVPSMERDPFYFTAEPSSLPSAAPSVAPSAMPTAKPSSAPSSTPTTAAPSSKPSAAPTVSYPVNDPPKSYSSKYFDYQPDGKRGPKNWDNVDDPPEGKYWKEEYGQYIEPSLGKSRCDSKSRRQSPIDVRFDKAHGQCFEYHGVRDKIGLYSIDDPKVETQILPSKLRIRYPNNFGDDWGGASENDVVKGPSADIPKGWGHQLPVTHVDIKIPSEHWMEGRQYAAEYQINIIQNRDSQRGAPIISVLFDIHPNNTANFRIQQLLDHFQAQNDADAAECEAKRRRERKLDAKLLRGSGMIQGDQSTVLDEPPEIEAAFQEEYRRKTQEQEKYRKFDVWDRKWIMTSDWFFGYEGSLTEPPCTEFLEWRIIDTPALISEKQLVQMKRILFNHVDKDCERTSVHSEEYGVARPLQSYSGRLVHRCMCRDFLGDETRREYGSNRCAWVDREKFGFDREQYSLDWYEKTHKYDDPNQQPLTDWASF